MSIPVLIGGDTAKSVFQAQSFDENELLSSAVSFVAPKCFASLSGFYPFFVAIESCASSQHWARLLRSFGHDVKLIPPQYVKPYVKRGKDDAADAEVLCEPETRPCMRFVLSKSKEQQAACMLMTVRERLVRVQSSRSNAFQSYAA